MEILKQSLFELKELLSKESNKTVSKLEPNPENPVGENLVPENPVPENDVLENPLPEYSVPENLVLENPVPENPVSNEIVSDSYPENSAKKEKVKKKPNPKRPILPNNRSIIYFCSEAACDGAFWENQELINHTRNCHPKSLPYKCSNCLEYFFKRDFLSHRKKCKKRFGKTCEMQKNIGRKSNLQHVHIYPFWDLWLKGETLGRIGKIICYGSQRKNGISNSDRVDFIPLNLKIPKSKSISENPAIEEEVQKSTEKPVCDPTSSNIEKSAKKKKKSKSKQNENPEDPSVPPGRGGFYFCVETACDAAFWKRENLQEQCLKSRPFASGPGRLGPKIPPGRADFGRKSSGPSRADLGRKFSRAGPIPKKLV